MSLLLVQGCSKSKKPATEPIPAFELYTGYFYKIIKKAKRDGQYRSDLDLCILSAEHGLIEQDTEITTYDLRMDQQRAAELRNDVLADLKSKIDAGNYERVVLNLGADYRQAIEGIESKTDVPIVDIQGQLGERGQTLKRLIRDEMHLEVLV